MSGISPSIPRSATSPSAPGCTPWIRWSCTSPTKRKLLRWVCGRGRGERGDRKREVEGDVCVGGFVGGEGVRGETEREK